MKLEKRTVIFIILVLVVMLISGTYGYFSLLISNPDDSTELYTGTLDVEYSQGDIIYEQSFYPRSAPKFADQDHVYNNKFVVTNTGTLDGIMEIKLDITNNGFSDGAIKYNLYNVDGYRVIGGTIPSSGDAILINQVRINSGQEVVYTLQLWLEETGTQQNIDENQRLTAAVEVNLTQYIE